MLAATDSLSTLAERFPIVVDQWSQYVAKVLREARSSMNILAKSLEHLSDRDVLYVAIDADVDREMQVGKLYANRLLESIKAAQETVDISEYMKRIGDTLTDVDAMPLLDTGQGLVVNSVSGVENAIFRVRPTRVGGQPKQDLSIVVPHSFAWGEHDYADALEAYLEHTGLSVGFLRHVTFPHSNIDSGPVVQSLRERGTFGRRRKVKYNVRRCSQGGEVSLVSGAKRVSEVQE